MDDRNLSLIVVPHGDLETRSFVISYRKLKVILVASICGLVLVAFIVASWFPVAILAARVPALKRDLARLEAERAQVTELARDLKDVEAQYDRVRKLLGADAPVAGSPPMLPPLRGDSPRGKNSKPISQGPAIRNWPLSVRGFVTQSAGTRGGSHPGIDIAVASDTDIQAAGDGIVYSAGLNDVYGKYIVIDHGAGYQTVYGHANRLLVEAGDVVKAGQKIALSGSTGRSTAPHLHFELRRDGAVVDPLQFIRQPN